MNIVMTLGGIVVSTAVVVGAYKISSNYSLYKQLLILAGMFVLLGVSVFIFGKLKVLRRAQPASAPTQRTEEGSEQSTRRVAESSTRKTGDKTLRAMGWVAFVVALIYAFGFLNFWFSNRSEKKAKASVENTCSMDSTFTVDVKRDFSRYYKRPPGCRLTYTRVNKSDSLEVETGLGSYQYGSGYPEYPMDIVMNKARFRSLMTDSTHVVHVSVRIHSATDEPGF